MKTYEAVVTEAMAEYAPLKSSAGDDEEVLCSLIYRLFHSGSASKAVGVQYLSELLLKYCKDDGIDTVEFRSLMPTYLVDAIDYVTAPSAIRASEAPSTHGREDD